MALENEKILKTTKKNQKNLKKSKFYKKKIAKTCDIKLKNYSMPIRNLLVTYYQPPENFFCPLGLERPE